MNEKVLEGRTAIVTGAGRGLGRAYALALAASGANVIVNDLGTDVAGGGRDQTLAHEVVDAILASGGKAIANSSDIAEAAGGRSLVEQALGTFSRIDIVVNNAGILQAKPFAETSCEDFDMHMRVHLGGHVNVSRAAWPHLSRQRYGRVIMTESGAGLYGLRNHSAYSAAKGAVHGLMRALAHDGLDDGILVNAVSPGGFSRMHEAANLAPEMLEWTKRVMAPELVAPFIVWLASEACTSTGKVYSAWSGRIARISIGSGAGFTSHALSPSLIAAHISEIDATHNLYEPRDSVDEISRWIPLPE